LHRRPDSRWKREEGVVAELAVLQDSMLRHGSTLLTDREGRMVYSVCTTTRAEAEEVIDSVVGQGVLELAEHPVRTWPHLHETDGFFIAQLQQPRLES
jgi:16S rRNA (cytosine967-C5)-methyltransferase